MQETYDLTGNKVGRKKVTHDVIHFADFPCALKRAALGALLEQFGINLIRIPVHVGFVCAWSNRVDLNIVFAKVNCKRLRHATDGKF